MKMTRGMIDCFLVCDDLAAVQLTVNQLRADSLIRHIHLLVSPEVGERGECPEGCTLLPVSQRLSVEAMLAIEQCTTADYVLLFTKATPITLGLGATQRLLRVATDSGAPFVYADHYSVEHGEVVRHPVIDYQEGSIRDDFDFGSMLLIRADMLHDYARQAPPATYRYAGLYDLRLFVSRQGPLLHLGVLKSVKLPQLIHQKKPWTPWLKAILSS